MAYTANLYVIIVFLKIIGIYTLYNICSSCTDTYVIFYHIACKFLAVNKHNLLARFFLCEFSCLAGKPACRYENTFICLFFIKCPSKSMKIGLSYSVPYCIAFSLYVNFI